MKELKFEKLDEIVYKEVLDNGIEVYMYPTKKTKNFYITISVKYGANILKYKVDNKINTIIPGSAHFLEHKVMSFSEDPKIVKKINNYGLQANAWTNWYGTNYNLYGSQNIEESLKLLLDMFYKPNITAKNVEEEKGIISEEIDMTNDNVNVYMTNTLLNNMFYNCYVNKTVLGDKQNISNITDKSLKKIYNDFYIPNNTFITLTGNFDKEEMMKLIDEYFKDFKIKQKPVPKRIKGNEKDTIRVSYQKITKDVESAKIKIGYKIKKNKFNIKNNDELKSYINIILNSNFDVSSDLYEKYKTNNIILDMQARSYIFDDYVVVIISASTKQPDKFIEIINEDLKELTLSEDLFERKKKLFLKSYILSFEDIVDIEDFITIQLIKNNKILTDEYSSILNMKYKLAKDVMKKLIFNNYSIVVTSK